MSAKPTVVQYCSSLGKACGISTYTQMLCEAQGLAAVRRMSDLPDKAVTHVHVQHEFGIMTLKELKAIRRSCDDRGIAMVVTMHTVIPLPSIREYARIWAHKIIRRLRNGVQRIKSAMMRIPGRLVKVAGAIVRTIDGLLMNGRFRLWERLDTWKNGVVPKPQPDAQGDAPTLQASAPIAYPEPVRWVWTAENPEYGWRSFLFFRACERFLIAKADTLVVHSEEARQALQAMGAKHVDVVPHGLSRYAVSPRLHSEEDGKLHVGCFGFLKAHKSLLDIIWSCEQLQNVELHLYTSIAHSDRHTEYYNLLERYIAGKPWIHLETAHLPLDVVVYRLSQCDVNVWYAAPPGAISTSGSIRQYLAAKRPIIASDTIMVSDIRHLIQTVPHGRTDLLIAALQSFQPKPENLNAYVNEHTWDRLFPAYELTAA